MKSAGPYDTFKETVKVQKRPILYSVFPRSSSTNAYVIIIQ